MAKVELHPLGDYHLRTGSLDIGTTAETIAFIAIPQSGVVKRVSACVQVAQGTAPALITFEVGGVTLKLGGSTATLSIPSAASSPGNVEAIAFDGPSSAVNEAEDGDAIAAGSVLEIITDAAGADGFATFIVTIGR